MSSQILITGATGFIGRQLTRDLIAQGLPVRILARHRSKAEGLFGSGVEVCVGDLDDASAVARACRNVDIVYHIGGIYRFGLRHRRELERINIEGAENVFRGADAARVNRVVHLSSGGVLKKAGREMAVPAHLDERDYPAKPPGFSSYKSSKWHSEQRALTWARRGLPVVIASTTCPIGSGDETPTPTGQIVRDFLQRRFPFYCHTALNFIDIRDLSHGLQAVAAKGRSGQRYLLSNENLWLKEFLDLLAQETGLPVPRRCLPNWAIRLAGVGGEGVDFANPRSKGARICLETASQAGRAQFFDNSRTQAELSWKPTRSIQESIRQSVTWFRRELEIESPESASVPLESTVQ